MLFQKTFSIINLLFLTVVLFMGAIPISWSANLAMFVLTLFFLMIFPILYAFNLYFITNKNIIAILELVFGLIFIYQVMYYFLLPFVPVLNVLAQKNIFPMSSVAYKASFSIMLFGCLYLSTFFTAKYFYTLKHRN